MKHKPIFRHIYFTCTIGNLLYYWDARLSLFAPPFFFIDIPTLVWDPIHLSVCDTLVEYIYET